MSWPPACRRAVHRQLFTSADTIWTSDDVLNGAFQRFDDVSRSTRRHGSFVPGPLEFRRRSGRRRMAQFSEATPTSPYTFPPMWNLFGAADRMKFQWQAPTPRPEAVIGWLDSWLPPVEKPALTAAASEMEDPNDIPSIAAQERFSRVDVANFQEAVRNAQGDEVLEVCSNFGLRLRQSLVIGELDNMTFHSALFTFKLELSQSPSRNYLYFNFCQEVWAGIAACKVAPISRYFGADLDILITMLSEIPISFEVQLLARGVLTSATTKQLSYMRQSVTKLIIAWVKAGFNGDPSTGAANELMEVERKVLSVDRLLGDPVYMETRAGSDHLHEIQQKIHEVKRGIMESIEAVDNAHEVLFPHDLSMHTLAHALEKFEKHSKLLSSIFMDCSMNIRHAIETASDADNYLYTCQYLSLVAKMPNADDRLLFLTTKAMFHNANYCIRPEASASLLLDHWISQGVLKNPSIIRNCFLSPRRADPVTDLLYIIKSHGEPIVTRTEEIFKVLRKGKGYANVPRILNSMMQHGIKLPLATFRKAFITLSVVDPHSALHVPALWKMMNHDIKSFAFDKCPQSVVSLIENSTVSASAIWRMLGIPRYYRTLRIPDPRYLKDPSERLSPSMVALITKMAIAFSLGLRGDIKTRYTFAYTHVKQCINFLRSCGNPVPAEMTKALTIAGIRLEIVEEQWIDNDKLAWILQMVEETEGPKVAREIDRIVYWHRELLVQKPRSCHGYRPRHKRQEETIARFIERQEKELKRLSKKDLRYQDNKRIGTPQTLGSTEWRSIPIEQDNAASCMQ